jgi:hypothetical protein
MKEIINKKALSSVVTTVLIVLLAIAAVGIISGIAIRTINKASLSPEYNCIDAITNKPITIEKACIRGNETEITIILNKDINSIKFVTSLGAERKSWSCGGSQCGCTLPEKFKTKTYYFPLKADKITLFAEQCESDTKDIDPFCN